MCDSKPGLFVCAWCVASNGVQPCAEPEAQRLAKRLVAAKRLTKSGRKSTEKRGG